MANNVLHPSNARARQQQPQSDKPQPAKEFRINAVKAAIWANQHEGRTFFNTTFERIFTKGEGDDKEWKSTGSFGRDDLLNLAKLADVAHSWILRTEQEARQA